MPTRLKTLAIATALAAGTASVAMAQAYVGPYPCPAGYVLAGGVCQPAATPGGIVAGALDTAGAIAGGALNAAGNIVDGTVGAVTAPPPYYGSSYPPVYPQPGYGR